MLADKFTGRFIFRAALTLAPAALLLGGCPTIWDTTHLAAPLAHVFNHKDSFARQADHPLADVVAGTVVDDLATLTGCWGAFTPDIAADDNLAAPIDDYTALRFGPASGEFTWWTLEDVGGYFPVILTFRGRYSVVDAHRLRLEHTSEEFYNPVTRKYESQPPHGEPVEWLATLSGEYLKMLMLVNVGDPPPAPGAPDYSIVFRRFDCGR